MITLHACERLSASISVRQCQANRERGVYACETCAGLGAVVAEIAGQEVEKREPRWKRPHHDYSIKGGESRKRTMRDRAIVADQRLGGALPLEEIDGHESVTIDLCSDEYRQLMARIDACAAENGTTLGDEILCRLSVLERYL